MKTLLALALLALASSEAQALITPTATSANSDADATFAPAALWNNVGVAGDSSGEYLGNGWIITANHVTRTDATHIQFQLTLAGVTRVWSGTGFQLGSHDIFLAQLSPDSSNNLPDAYGALGVSIPTTSPALGSAVTLIGYGRVSSATNYYTVSGSTWTASTALNPLSVAAYSWGPAPTKTWGTNTIWGSTASNSVIPGTSTPISDFTVAKDAALGIDFSSTRHNGLPASQDAVTQYETGAAVNDSGAGVFANINGSRQLVGLVDTVAPWNGQPANTTSASNYNFAVDLTRYATEINAIVVPEPSVFVFISTGLIMSALSRRRFTSQLAR